MYGNSGNKKYLWLKQINSDTGLPTGARKLNEVGDADYVAPVSDTTTCPIPTIVWQGADPYCVVAKTCPDGYTLSSDGTICTKVATTAPTTADTSVHAARATNGAYTNYGALIYSPGFHGDGTGTTTGITTPYWINPGNTTDGPMNRNGVWVDNNNDGTVDSLTAGKQLAISFGLDVPIAKTYYFGVGGDNQVMLQINNVTVINRTNKVDSANFKYWHIYPVYLSAGYNIVTLTGTGDGSVQDSIAMEIYDNTPSQLSAATQDSNLNILFATKQVAGGTLQVVTCPNGYSPIDAGDGSYTCQEVLKTTATTGNTGQKAFTNRIRIINGVQDTSSKEANTQTGGNGTYIAPVTDTTTCP